MPKLSPAKSVQPMLKQLVLKLEKLSSFLNENVLPTLIDELWSWNTWYFETLPVIKKTSCNIENFCKTCTYLKINFSNRQPIGPWQLTLPIIPNQVRKFLCFRTSICEVFNDVCISVWSHLIGQLRTSKNLIGRCLTLKSTFVEDLRKLKGQKISRKLKFFSNYSCTTIVFRMSESFWKQKIPNYQIILGDHGYLTLINLFFMVKIRWLKRTSVKISNEHEIICYDVFC